MWECKLSDYLVWWQQSRLGIGRPELEATWHSLAVWPKAISHFSHLSNGLNESQRETEIMRIKDVNSELLYYSCDDDQSNLHTDQCEWPLDGLSPSVQSLSCVQLFVTPWTTACQAPLSIANSQSLLKLMSIESVMPSNHLILCLPLLLLPSIFPSIRGFSNESVLCIRWPKYWSCSFSISPSNEYLGLISFRMDWLDLLAVQGTLKSLLQHHSSKASILQCSAFFILQLSHPYMTTRKTIVFTIWTFVGKVMSCLSLKWKICQIKWISYWCTLLNQFFWPSLRESETSQPFHSHLIFISKTNGAFRMKTSKHHFH